MSTLSREEFIEAISQGEDDDIMAVEDHDAYQRAELAEKDREYSAVLLDRNQLMIDYQNRGLEITRLTAERDEARKDSTRLNWLENHPGSIEPRANGSTWVAKIGTGYLIAEVRDLIDSAMEQEKRK